MFRIAICCGGGFSSSALASHLGKGLEELGLQEEVSFIFIPINALVKRQNEVDIAMVCPHSEYVVKREAKNYKIPVTVIPPRLYGLMPTRDFIEDAQDLYELWKGGRQNPMTFEDEPKPLAVKRGISHRRMLAKKAGK